MIIKYLLFVIKCVVSFWGILLVFSTLAVVAAAADNDDILVCVQVLQQRGSRR